MRRRFFAGLMGTAALALSVVVPQAAVAGTPVATATNSDGLGLEVAIAQPADGAVVGSPHITLRGTANTILTANSAAVYTVDISGSTNLPAGPGRTIGDCNGDGAADDEDDLNGNAGVPSPVTGEVGGAGTVLDCEIAAVQSLHRSLLGSQGVEVSLVGFTDGAVQADMSPQPGFQPHITLDPTDLPDLDAVATSLRTAIVGEHTKSQLASDGTSLENALAVTANVIGNRGAAETVVWLITDGQDGSYHPNHSPSFQRLLDAGTRVNVVSVGSSAIRCIEDDVPSSLGTTSILSGGRCVDALNPTQVTGALVGTASSIEHLSASVNGGPRQAVTTRGNWAATLGPLREGPNRIEIIATSYDGTEAIASVDVTYQRPAVDVAQGMNRLDDDLGTCRTIAPQDGTASRVLVARDDLFADLLSAAPLLGPGPNGDRRACVLFVPGGSDGTLPAAVLDEAQRALGPSGEIIVMGGHEAVSRDIERALSDEGLVVQRLGGNNRYDTSVIVANRLRNEATGGSGPLTTPIIVASGAGWPDAVTAGAAAAAGNIPILLTLPGSVPQPVDDFLRSGAVTVTETWVVGGTDVIGTGVLAQMPNGRRIAGPNRMGTAAEVARHVWPRISGDVSGYVFVNLDRPDGWQLALAAAPLSASLSAPQLGVRAGVVPEETTRFLDEEMFGPVPQGVVMGELSFVSDEVQTRLADYLRSTEHD